MIDVGWPQQHYARTAGWAGQRFPLLPRLLGRWSGGGTQQGSEAGFVYRAYRAVPTDAANIGAPAHALSRTNHVIGSPHTVLALGAGSTDQKVAKVSRLGGKVSAARAVPLALADSVGEGVGIVRGAPPRSTVSAGLLADRLSQRASQTPGVIAIRRSQQQYSRSGGWFGQSVPLLNALLGRYRPDQGTGIDASGLVYRLAAASAGEVPHTLVNASPIVSLGESAPLAAVRGESSPPSTASMRVRRRALSTADDAVPAATGKWPTATVVGERRLVTRGLANGRQLPSTANLADPAPGLTHNTVANTALSAADRPSGMVARPAAMRPAADGPELVVARRVVDKPGSTKIETAAVPLATSVGASTGDARPGGPASMQTRREVLPPSDYAVRLAIDKWLAVTSAVEDGGRAVGSPNQPAAPSSRPFIDASGNRRVVPDVGPAATLPLIARRQALSPLASGNAVRQATGESLAKVVRESTAAMHGSIDDSQLPRIASDLTGNAVANAAPAADHQFAASDRLLTLQDGTGGGSEWVMAHRTVNNPGLAKGETVAASRSASVAVPTGVGLPDGLVFVQASHALPPPETTPPTAARPAGPLVRERAASPLSGTVSGLVWRRGITVPPETRTPERVTADVTSTAAVAASPGAGGMLSTSADSYSGVSAPGSHLAGVDAALNWEQLIAQLSRRMLRQMTIERERRGWKGWN